MPKHSALRDAVTAVVESHKALIRLLKSNPTLLSQLRGELSQLALARRADVHQPHISLVESGNFKHMSMEQLISILSAYTDL